MIDDDEGPPAGSNQGKSSKRRRTRESESAKKPSTTKEPPRIKNQRAHSQIGLCRRIGKEELSKADLKLDHLQSNTRVEFAQRGQFIDQKHCHKETCGRLAAGIESYQTKLNMEQPNWDASDFPFKEDYTIVFKPRAVIYRDRDDNRKMMRIDEVHKFSDGTLTRIKEKLDFMVKDFKLFKFNKGMENRKWTEDDKMNSEDFNEVNREKTKIRRIYSNLESFVGGD
ncbi:hypothetical protein Tco_1329082 [Tanacetum coccineum]